MQTSYGATDSSNCDTLPSKKLPKWADKGSLFSIAMSVGTGTLAHLVFTFAIFESISSAQGGLFRCDGKGSELTGAGGHALCSYVSSYIECYPEFTTAVVLILAARNLLQTRFYYKMLENNAVVLFNSRSMLQDWLIRLYLWCYLHVVCHLLLIMYMVGKYGSWSFIEDDLEAAKRHANYEQNKKNFPVFSPDDIKMLTGLFTLILVPSTLFIVFLHGAYDIEKGFVPLSEYFHDSLDPDQVMDPGEEDSRPFQPRATCTLVAVPDIAAKVVVDDYEVDAIADANSNGTMVEGVIDRYVKQGGEIKKMGLPCIGLYKCLWSARLLDTKDKIGFSEGGFAWVYIVFAAISVILICVFELTMGFVLVTKSQTFIHSVTVLAQMGAIGSVGIAFALSLRA